MISDNPLPACYLPVVPLFHWHQQVNIHLNFSVFSSIDRDIIKGTHDKGVSTSSRQAKSRDTPTPKPPPPRRQGPCLFSTPPVGALSINLYQQS